MSGVKLHIAIDDRQINAALDRLIAVGQHPRAVMKDIAADGRRSTQDRFIDGVAPDGSSWEPNKQGTKTLVASRILLGSITRESGDDYAEWGTNKIYAAIHQFGGVIRPKNKPYLTFKLPGGGFRRVKQVTIPARPYLGINEDDEENIVDIVNRHLQEAVTN